MSIVVSCYSHTPMGTSVINRQNGLCFFGFLVFLDNVFYKISVDYFTSRQIYCLTSLLTIAVNMVSRYLGIVSRSADILVEMLADYHDY